MSGTNVVQQSTLLLIDLLFAYNLINHCAVCKTKAWVRSTVVLKCIPEPWFTPLYHRSVLGSKSCQEFMHAIMRTTPANQYLLWTNLSKAVKQGSSLAGEGAFKIWGKELYVKVSRRSFGCKFKLYLAEADGEVRPELANWDALMHFPVQICNCK